MVFVGFYLINNNSKWTQFKVPDTDTAEALFDALSAKGVELWYWNQPQGKWAKGGEGPTRQASY